MNSPRFATKLRALAAGVALALPFASWAFSSGSSGADGALAPTVNTEVVLPESGVLNYTSINIPTGVTVTFRKNTTNTPVVLLVSGDATIAGTIDVRGKTSADVGAGGSGSVGDDGAPGSGGPGGYSGGRGGLSDANPLGGAGAGPGGGRGGVKACNNTYPLGGGGAGHAGAGDEGYSNYCGGAGNAGIAYGSAALLPLVGGSGGGGGAGGSSFAGSGGGGGGGALLIAASGTVNVTGTIAGNGGAGGNSSGAGCGITGGGGSGGAIRLIATTIAGNGVISAVGGGYVPVTSCTYYAYGGSGSAGRVRLEAETYTRTAASTPAHTFSAPGPIFITGLPTLAITTVAGVAVPASPTGVADVSLPTTTTNPVTVVFQTTGVPVGNTITVKVTPAYGATSSALSTALTGTTANATASATITLPTGPSTLQATVTYTIVASLGDLLRHFAQGERVEKISLSALPGSKSKATLITVSGKRFEAPAEALQIAAFGR